MPQYMYGQMGGWLGHSLTLHVYGGAPSIQPNPIFLEVNNWTICNVTYMKKVF